MAGRWRNCNGCAVALGTAQAGGRRSGSCRVVNSSQPGSCRGNAVRDLIGSLEVLNLKRPLRRLRFNAPGPGRQVWPSFMCCARERDGEALRIRMKSSRAGIKRDTGSNLSIQSVSKCYRGKIWALREFSLGLGPGVPGLLGSSGAGKTTLMSGLAEAVRRWIPCATDPCRSLWPWNAWTVTNSTAAMPDRSRIQEPDSRSPGTESWQGAMKTMLCRRVRHLNPDRPYDSACWSVKR